MPDIPSEPHATHVVVDTFSGFMFSEGVDNAPFRSSIAAQSFADARNGGLAVRTYKAFRLVPDASPQAYANLRSLLASMAEEVRTGELPSRCQLVVDAALDVLG